jgi:putative transposase
MLPVRPLRSTGITPLLRYYGPLRLLAGLRQRLCLPAAVLLPVQVSQVPRLFFRRTPSPSTPESRSTALPRFFIDRAGFTIFGRLEVCERRNQLRHPNYARPELLATHPNQLWSWDITKLLGPVKWTYYYLYDIMDVFSRYVVGWLIAERESAHLAEALITATCVRQNIQPDQLTIHADRGSSMTSKPVALLMADLGVTKTHSRPHVSNDNPFSEAQFKTLKYRPDYPGRFGCQVDARGWAQNFFQWYNYQHHHSALGLLTPADVHFGRAPAVLAQRQLVLAAAYQKNPQRFVKGHPASFQLPPRCGSTRPGRS